MGCVVRDRARRSAPGARHRALPPCAAASPHAHHHGSRLPRRSRVSAGRKPQELWCCRRPTSADSGTCSSACTRICFTIVRETLVPMPLEGPSCRSFPSSAPANDPADTPHDRSRRRGSRAARSGACRTAAVIIADDRIAAIESRIDRHASGRDPRRFARLSSSCPGFIDVHVHGVEGHDVLDGPGAVAEVASRLPRYGVTAFCPTSVACAPSTLRQLLARSMRARQPAGGGRGRMSCRRISKATSSIPNSRAPSRSRACARAQGLRRWQGSDAGPARFHRRDILASHRGASRVGAHRHAWRPRLNAGWTLVRAARRGGPPRLDWPHRRDLRTGARGH